MSMILVHEQRVMDGAQELDLARKKSRINIDASCQRWRELWDL